MCLCDYRVNGREFESYNNTYEMFLVDGNDSFRDLYL